eukprot:scaffold1519_cov166-Amphora_coffeaeformis.AAC.21
METTERQPKEEKALEEEGSRKESAEGQLKQAEQANPPALLKPPPKEPTGSGKILHKRTFQANNSRQKSRRKEKRFYDPWFNFYFRRTSVDGCRVGDLEFLVSPSKGALPSPNVTATATEFIDPTSWSLFDIQPQSDEWIFQLHWISMGQGVLLLLGILPRFQVLGIYLNLVSLHRRNDVMLDDEDTLLRLWAFFLVFLPLHHFTIYDLFRKYRRRDESWPMWPWRLWQTEMILIYWSSSMNKLLDPNCVWIAGDALYWMAQSSPFYPGLLNPDLFFNCYLPLKFSCWYILIAECTCWVGIWMEDMQADIIAIMIVPPRVPTGLSGLLVKLLIVLLTFGMAVDVFPPRLIVGVKNQTAFHNFRRHYVKPVLRSTGIWQEPWDVYHMGPFPETSYYQAFIQLRNGTVVDRRSPNWSTMTWLERKKTVRLKKYFTNLATAKEAWVSYCEHVIRDMEDDVLAVELVRLYERARAPRNETRWMARMRQPLDKGWVSLVVVRLCKDNHENCESLVSQGNCQRSPKFMQDTCRKSCGFCNQLEVAWGNGVEGQIGNLAAYTPEQAGSPTALTEKADNGNGSQCVILNEDTTDTCH